MLGWDWAEPNIFQTNFGRLDMLALTKSEWKEVVERAIWDAEASRNSVKRKDMRTARPQADWRMCVRMHQGMKPRERVCLQAMLTGSFRSFERLHQAGLRAHDTCQWCDARGTTKHLLWECRRYEEGEA